MNIPSGYSFSYQQLNPITFRAFVKTPENLIFSTQFQGQPNDNAIFEALKTQKNNFVIELQENKDIWVDKQK